MSYKSFCKTTLLLASVCVVKVWAGQAHTGRNNQSQMLVVTGNLEVKSELAQAFIEPIVCDQDGNIYVMNNLDGVSGIKKFSPKGERVASFIASSAQDLKIQVAGFFSVTATGDLYQLVYPQKTLDRAVLVFSRDGSYKSTIKLDPGFRWIPTQVAAFPSGDIVVSGLKYDPTPDVHIKQPFTGIFSPDGTLRKEVTLTDDQEITNLAASGDSRVVAADHPFGNRAIENGQMSSAADGNVYLLRRLSPAIIYAISPGGDTKRITIDPGSADYIPTSMHISGARIAVLFQEPQTGEELVKVVGLDGRHAATYADPSSKENDSLGPAFACYTDSPQKFTFLFTTDAGNVGFRIAEPR